MNKCIRKDEVLAVIALDVVSIYQWVDKSKGAKNLTLPLLSEAWDGFTKAKIKQINNATQPDQPILLTAIPFRKQTNNRWLVEQKRVPLLLRYNFEQEIRDIDGLNLMLRCSSRNPKPFDQGRCDSNSEKKALYKKNTRALWTIYPN